MQQLADLRRDSRGAHKRRLKETLDETMTRWQDNGGCVKRDGKDHTWIMHEEKTLDN